MDACPDGRLIQSVGPHHVGAQRVHQNVEVFVKIEVVEGVCGYRTFGKGIEQIQEPFLLGKFEHFVMRESLLLRRLWRRGLVNLHQQHFVLSDRHPDVLAPYHRRHRFPLFFVHGFEDVGLYEIL